MVKDFQAPGGWGSFRDKGKLSASPLGLNIGGKGRAGSTPSRGRPDTRDTRPLPTPPGPRSVGTDSANERKAN